MSDVVRVLDSLDLVLSRAAAVLSDEELAEPAASAREIRDRRGHVGDTLVLALAGGTGSGKSSLLNALAGEKIASVSRIRPHTDLPLAWIPVGAEASLGTLLDRYGIAQRVPQDRLPGLAVIDLPDHDSIIGSHRATVGGLLPRVDAVIWIVDPEKYRDRVLHEDYLVPLLDYQDQFTFVLNQVDRLGDGVGSVAADFEEALRDDGYVAPVVFPLAADPPFAPPQGIEHLENYLRDRLDTKRMAMGKILSDVRRLATVIGHRARLRSGSAVGFDDRWARVKAATALALLDGEREKVPEDALCRVEDFVVAVSVETGGSFGTRLRSSFPAERLESELQAALLNGDGSAPIEPVKPRFLRRVPPPGEHSGPAADVAAELDRRVGEPLRELLWERAILAAGLVGLEVEIAEAELRLRR